MKKCPYCAEMVQNDAVLCRYCNREIPLSPTSQVQPSTVPPKKASLPIPLRIAIVASIAWCVLGAAYLLFSAYKEAKLKASQPVAGKYTHQSYQELNNAMLSLSKAGLIKQVDVASRSIFVDRALWATTNINQKTTVAQFMADFIGSQTKGVAYVRIKDYQSGKELAEYDYAGYSSKE